MLDLEESPETEATAAREKSGDRREADVKP
jgi:hypothetical protein